MSREALIALMDAIGQKDGAAAAAALEAGADIDGVLARGVSAAGGYIHSDVPPLTWAARKDPKRIKWLVSQGADINAPNGPGQETPLLTAARQGLSKRAIKALLAAGADPDRADNEQATALHAAARQGKLPVIQLLLASGANLNTGKHDPAFGLPGIATYTPLYEAIVSNQEAAALVLLEAGADPNTGQSDRWLISPLGMAIKHKDTVLCRALLDAGARTDEAVLSSDLRRQLETLLGLTPAGR